MPMARVRAAACCLPPGIWLREMSSCGMLLDLTHISDESFYEAVDLYKGPVLASHQNCRALVPGQRQFTDDQLRIVIERGGVIGASMDTWMLCPWFTLDWSDTGGYSRRDHFRREDISLSHAADHIDHVCQVAGNADHAAIGGDTDGQGGIDGAALRCGFHCRLPVAGTHPPRAWLPPGRHREGHVQELAAILHGPSAEERLTAQTGEP